MALLLALTGCAYAPLRAATPAPRPLPAELAVYYDYPDHHPKAAVEPVADRRRFREFLVRFPLSAAGFEPTEPTVEFEWFESAATGRRPAVLFNPILGGDYPLERGICRYLAARGFHVALIHRKTLKISPEHPASHLELLLRQGILRIRQVTDWMAAQERVDPDRLGSFGISMGGMATVMAAAVEPRLREAVRTDPLALAPYVDPSELVMFIAVFDRTVGRANELRLWRALGRPAVTFMPAGHYTAYFLLPYVKYQGLRFLKERLEP